MILELSEEDYTKLGMGLPVVRTMLRKAAEIVNHSQ